MTAVTAALLAHEGGWDEALLIGGPMVVIAVLLVIAKRRVDAAAVDDVSRPGSAPDQQTP